MKNIDTPIGMMHTRKNDPTQKLVDNVVAKKLELAQIDLGVFLESLGMTMENKKDFRITVRTLPGEFLYTVYDKEGKILGTKKI